nr:hypothetical protein [Tanacetum cinerariifolium]
RKEPGNRASEVHGCLV